MLPVFVNPWAFLGFLSIPVLIAIYVLRNRHRRYEVSSLLLWLDPREARSGGPRIERFQAPILFFLELLLLLLLVLAAANPYVRSSRNVRPLMVVLDDSFSMSAGGDDSTRSRGQKALEELLQEREGIEVHLIVAGEQVRTLGEGIREQRDLHTQLEGWTCRSPTANLESGISLASELGGELALILIITDQSPPMKLEKGRTQWWAFGGYRPNLAFVTAVRQDNRCLIELANLSDEEQSTTLELQSKRQRISLKPNEVQRLTLDLPENTGQFTAKIPSDDALSMDDRIQLLPVQNQPLRVGINMQAGQLRTLIEKVLKGPEISIVEKDAEIIFTDDIEKLNAPSGAWVVDVLAEKDAEAYLGPFLLNRSHPLTQGLDLEGRIWSAGKSTELPGEPIILAGKVPLLSVEGDAYSAKTIHLRIRPDLSTIQGSPNWPILITNILYWRSLSRPGLTRTNLRLGEESVLRLTQPIDIATLVSPDGKERTVSATAGRVVLRAEDVGVYEIRIDDKSVQLAANALNSEESDLRSCVSGQWGDWLDKTSLRLEYRSIVWIFLLLALLVASLHLYLAHRLKRG